MFFLGLKGGVWWIVFWPAVSFFLVAISYLLGTTFVFGKRIDGSRHWLATVVLGPHLAFAWTVWSLQVFASQKPAWQVVNDSLIVGRRLRPHEFPDEVDVICDLTSEMLDPKPIRNRPGYVCVPMLDANGMATDKMVALVQSLCPNEGRRILIHCANGYGRTGTVAAAWLVAHRFVESADQALELLQSKRPGLRLRRRQRDCLDEVAKSLRRSTLQSENPSSSC